MIYDFIKKLIPKQHLLIKILFILASFIFYNCGDNMEILFHEKQIKSIPLPYNSLMISNNTLEENEIPLGMTIDNNDRILVWGRIRYLTEDYDAVVWRFNIDGTLDTSFGTNGRIVWDSPAVGLNDLIYSVKVKNDNSLLFGGTSTNISNQTEILLGKFDANGQPDTGFSPDGFRVIDCDNTKVKDFINVAFDANDRLLATGYFFSDSIYDAGIVRVTASGDIDTGFGTNGYFTWNTDESPVFGAGLKCNGSNIMFYSGNIYLSVWAVQGLWLFSGVILELSETDGTLQRVIADIPCSPIPVRGEGAFAIENGYIYFGGTTGQVDPMAPVWSACVAKVDHSTFTLDPAFGTNGVQASNLFPTYQGNDARVPVSVENGEVYVGSWTDTNEAGPLDLTTKKGIILKTTSSGELDTSWQDSGKVFIEDPVITGSNDSIASSLIYDDILISIGSTQVEINSNNYYRLLIKYTPKE